MFNRPSVFVLAAMGLFMLLAVFGAITVPLLVWVLWLLIGLGLLVTGH